MSGRKPTSFAHGVIAAAVLSVSGAAVLAALTPFFGAGTALRAVIALLGFAYVLYVQSVSGERVGRVTTIVLWLLAATATWVVGVPFVGYVLIHAGLLWLVRSLVFLFGRAARAARPRVDRARARIRGVGGRSLGQPLARPLVFLPRASAARLHPRGDRRRCGGGVSTTRSKRSTAPTKQLRPPCAGCPRCGSPRLAIPSFITETKS